MTKEIARAHRVPFNQKFAFGMGMLANQMFPAVLGVFMVVLVEGLGFPTWAWAILYFLPRLLDAITDPVMGLVTDNTRSKYGRRKQYVFLGALILGISFVFMWQLYSSNGLTFNFFYFLLFSFVFYLGLTIFSVPYVAMGYEMSDDFHERTNIMAVAQWIGQWAWVIAPWFWFAIYKPEWFASPEAACRELAVWVGIIFALVAIYPAVFVKSKSTLDREDLVPITLSNIKSKLKDIFAVAKEVFQLKPFQKICVSTFLIFGTFNTVANLTFFIIVHYMFGGDAGSAGVWPILHGSVGALVTTFLVIPVVAALSKRIGKKNTFLVSQSISIIGYILFWFLFIPGKPYMFLFALPFFSFGIGGLFTIMMSMTSDICDLDELQSGKRREGIIGAIYWWMVKIGFAMAGLLAGLYMSLVGFDSALDVQSTNTITDMRFFYTVFPIIGTLIAIYIMKDYELDEQRATEIREELNAKKAKHSGSSGLVKSKLLELHAPGYAEKRNLFSIDTLNSDFLSESVQSHLQAGVHGLCFSPYLEGQGLADELSPKQIETRLGVIKNHTSWIRTFSCTGGNELIPSLAKNLNLKTAVGAWIGEDADRNRLELDNLLSLIEKGWVDMAVVGNEVLLREDLSKVELLQVLKDFKKRLPQGVKLAYVDAYYIFLEHQELIDICDVVMINCYPFWEGFDISKAVLALDKMHYLVKHYANQKEVIIAETGWPSEGQHVKEAVPSKLNAAKYFVEVQEWAKNEGIKVFYFSSFDETWKVKEEGELGARWGLWNAKEQFKY